MIAQQTFEHIHLYLIVPVPTTISTHIAANHNTLPKPTSTEIFYVAVGIASGVIILVAVIIFTLYMRTRKQTLMGNDQRPR